MSLLKKAKSFGGNLLDFAVAYGDRRYTPEGNAGLEELAGPEGSALARTNYDRNFRAARWQAIRQGAGPAEMDNLGHAGATPQYNADIAQAIAVTEALKKQRLESGRTKAISDYIRTNTSLTDNQRALLEAAGPEDATAQLLKKEFAAADDDNYVVTPIGGGSAIRMNKRDGKYEVIRDPNAAASIASSMITPGAVDLMAEQYLSTGKMPAGISRSDKTIVPRIMARASEIAESRGDSPAAAVMRSRANEANRGALKLITEQYHGITAYERSMQAHLQNAVDIGKSIDRTGKPAIDRWLLAGKTSLAGDPQVAALHAAITSAMDEYAKILSGGVRSSAAITEGAREQAESMLSMASSQDQLVSVQRLISLDAEQKRIALENQRQAIMGEMTPTGSDTVDYGPASSEMPTIATPIPGNEQPNRGETAAQRAARLKLASGQ